MAIITTKFSIFTICTENYKGAADIMVPSWINTPSVDQIYIYSDFDLHMNNDKLVINKSIDKTTDWLKVVGLKAHILKQFIHEHNPVQFAFIDIDCYFRKDPSEVFDNTFDIAPTRMYEAASANSGVWFCNNSNGNLIKFADEWITMQDEYERQRSGVIKHHPSYSQLSFSKIVHREHKATPGYLKVHPLDFKVYNCYPGTRNWADDIKKYDSRILHFKGDANMKKWKEKKYLSVLK